MGKNTMSRIYSDGTDIFQYERGENITLEYFEKNNILSVEDKDYNYGQEIILFNNHYFNDYIGSYVCNDKWDRPRDYYEFYNEVLVKYLEQEELLKNKNNNKKEMKML